MKTFIVKLKGASSMPEIKIQADSAAVSSDVLTLSLTDGTTVAEFTTDALAGWWEEGSQVK